MAIYNTKGKKEQLSTKSITLIISLSACFAVIWGRLFFLQIVEEKYLISSLNNALRYETVYAPRGLIYDRDGQIIAGNTHCYDIIVTPYDVKEFDTLALCKILGIEREYVEEKFNYYRKYRSKIGNQSVNFLNQISIEKYSVFEELKYKFHGFSGVPRTIRFYPNNVGGNLLGYLNEVDPNTLATNENYKAGDFIGRSGIEKICEEELRGEKGYVIHTRNASNKIMASYEDGKHDKAAVPGQDITSTLNTELQAYGELLMKGKVGSLVALDPNTGEILALVSSPGIETSKLTDINKHYESISKDPYKPMLNRAVMSFQPPGSIFKIANALVALDEGVISSRTSFSCYGEYRGPGITVGCRDHKPNVNLAESLMTSCNSYYCNIFRMILDNPKYESVGEAMNVWTGKIKNLGFGRVLGSDFSSENPGLIPDRSYYDRIYGVNRWSPLYIISLSIGQGEIGCNPLQLANFGAILANRGHYYPPHIIRYAQGHKNEEKYSTAQVVDIDKRHFETVIQGMHMVVNGSREDGATATLAKVEGLDICGKTGTIQNPQGENHVAFLGFAPRNNPKIVVATYLENSGGGGGSWAAPLSSLLMEKYLNGSIDPKREWSEKRILEAELIKNSPIWRALNPDSVVVDKLKL